MGRKIPGKKHRGVNDPEKQQAERLAKIKDKINAPPLNPEDQQVPRSLSRIIELKNRAKQGLFNKKQKKKEKSAQKPKISKGKPEKPLPKFERRPGESDWIFKRRMNRICQDVIRETAFEDKYNVDIKRNEDGEVEGVEKRPKDELQVLMKKVRKENKEAKTKKKKKKPRADSEPKLTKSQKWALKQAEKKRKKQLATDQDHSYLPQKEQIKFGEIVHAPPSLVAPRRVDKSQETPRPGQKQLLLKSIFANSENSSGTSNRPLHSTKSSVSNASKSINKKGKRKDLPHAMRRQLDKQQKEIIEAYKILKSKKIKTTN
uniref:Coiled-coil domain-containing protein 137 n=1 Tax=Dendroctonus ponderosae TaxID=77166 RepID=J3JTV5_DENPD|nr:unknown [Dendroctonus ponderosae]